MCHHGASAAYLAVITTSAAVMRGSSAAPSAGEENAIALAERAHVAASEPRTEHLDGAA